MTAVLPASTDTPLFHNAANHTGHAIQPIPPVAAPERVAEAIVRMAERPRRRPRAVGGAARLAIAFHALAPGLFNRLAAPRTEDKHLQDRPAPPSPGNLFEPSRERGRTGGWRQSHGTGQGPSGRRGVLLATLAGALLGALAYRYRQPLRRRLWLAWCRWRGRGL